jgi:hypothetical protein
MTDGLSSNRWPLGGDVPSIYISTVSVTSERAPDILRFSQGASVDIDVGDTDVRRGFTTPAADGDR